jgi:chorismate mutase
MARTTNAAVRGAISVRANRAADIREATGRLLETLIRRNGVRADKVVSAVFTATPDLTADFPAHAARRIGWTDVPLLGAVELGVPGAPERIVRVLLTLRDVPRGVRLIPVYLDEAAKLRPDWPSLPAAEDAARAARDWRRAASPSSASARSAARSGLRSSPRAAGAASASTHMPSARRDALAKGCGGRGGGPRSRRRVATRAGGGRRCRSTCCP